jgi:hypothetical protein
MSRRCILLLAFFASMTGVTNARADEIRLKDGSKISGTIVGFENGAFRVETSYGFALIQKDKVADINITAAKKDLENKAPSAGPDVSDLKSKPEPQAKSTPASPPPPAASSIAAKSAAKDPLTPPLAPAIANKPENQSPPLAANAATAATKRETLAVKVKALDPAPPVAPPAPQPVVIRDEIHGNLYVNYTYNFQMFKPPSWDVIPAARKALPNAVAALGTFDETTLLVIGREPSKNSLQAQADATAKALSSVYENYRVISTRRVSVAGSPAIEQHARGAADGHDWSVTLLTLIHGGDEFTLLGMTWADSDLIQMQENIISKAVNSLTFTTPQ